MLALIAKKWPAKVPTLGKKLISTRRMANGFLALLGLYIVDFGNHWVMSLDRLALGIAGSLLDNTPRGKRTWLSTKR
ncbi:unnamed protein product [Candida parapsilosis]